jgi:hypothetical protein
VDECRRTIKEIRQALPGQLGHVFGEAIPAESIRLADGSRSRVFNTRTTFWAFLGQVLRGGSLREAVREVQATRQRLGLDPISDSTAGYSSARTRLSEEMIEEVHEGLCRRLEAESFHEGRRVLVVDGSSAQLADTPANQLDYPQPGEQRPGCGWPVMQAVALYDLHTGGILRVAESALNDHEAGWFQVDLIDSVRKNDIVLTDRGFCSYLTFGLIAGRGADAVARLHASRKNPFKGRENDCTTVWKRPWLSQMPPHILNEEWEQLPETMLVRCVRFTIKQPGSRSRNITLATTLLFTPIEELIELYRRRWDIELCFRDIKTTLGMEKIHCRTPAMARKQLLMFLIAHNLIRWLIQRAGQLASHSLRRLSFKGTIDAVLRWIPEMHVMSAARQKAAFVEMLRSIASDLVPDRPCRLEPRLQKTRPKFRYLTLPRRNTTTSTCHA